MKHAYPPDILEFVQRSLATGEFASEEDVVLAGMRALSEARQRHLSLRDDVQAALMEIDAGQCEPWDIDNIKAELIAQLDAEEAGF
jgi:Arc/MetJ-type ribon-helix-helix transcriptional regulator